MEWLVLLVGFESAAVTLALGFNVLPLAFLALTVATVLVLRDWNRRRG